MRGELSGSPVFLHTFAAHIVECLAERWSQWHLGVWEGRRKGSQWLWAALPWCEGPYYSARVCEAIHNGGSHPESPFHIP